MTSTSIDRRTVLAALGGGVIAAQPGAAAQATAMLVPENWATAERLPLWPGTMPGGGAFAAGTAPSGLPKTFAHDIARPELRVFRPAHPNGAALLVMPGGGYVFVSIRGEGTDIAARMAADGYTVFVLLYRLPGEGWAQRADVPLIDAQRAMRIIRHNAARYRIDPAKIAAIGFSAGGHLCASLATGFAEELHPPLDAIDRLDARPIAAALGYPVVTMAAPDAHGSSTRMLLGPDPDAAAIARRSPDRHVGPGTPPLFLFHAVDDPIVPLNNTLRMVEAMQQARRPVEAHIFARGGHGFGLGVAGTRAAEWPALFSRWLAGAGNG